jgi:DNA repair protein RecO (recombination protein O)
MKTCVSPSIIMRTRDFGESDLFVTFFTADKGRLNGIAKGARKSRRRFANCLDIFCFVNLEYDERKTKDLCFLHSGKLLDNFAGIRKAFSALALASYMIELTEALFPLSVVDIKMFELLRNCLAALSNGGSNDIIRVLFEVKAMSLGGYRINFSQCCGCGRLYTGAGQAVFVRSKGGIACLKCRQATDASPGLDPTTVKLLMLIQSIEFDFNEGMSIAAGIIDQIKPVLKLHLDYHIGYSLKTSKYME